MAEPTWDKSRVEPFSDGVLAIAITLLVLEIRLPEDTRGHLPRALRELWPSYSAYLRSFLVIGIIWANHHSLFRLIARCDEGLLFTKRRAPGHDQLPAVSDGRPGSGAARRRRR